MVNFFRAPLPGEKVLMICGECKKIFNGTFGGRNKCPHCGSTRVGQYPGVRY